MALYHDVKYLRMVSSKLERFKINKDDGQTFAAKCRCPICGDSEKSERKTRGNFHSFQNSLFYKCFNCDASLSFSKFLFWLDRPIYDQYRLETFKSNDPPPPTVAEDVAPTNKGLVIFNNLLSINELSKDHEAREYIESRRIPTKFYSKMFLTDEFYRWSSSHTDKFSNAKLHDKEHPRILIPWYDINHNIFAYQARSIRPHPIKYLSMVLDKKPTRVFGIERINPEKRIYVVEGPIDSMFLDNAVAVGTSALHTFVNSGETTYVCDNENRNKEVLKIYQKLINMGRDVCIMPSSYKYKDINEAVLENVDVKSVIDYNTFSGPKAQLVFNEWKRVQI